MNIRRTASVLLLAHILIGCGKSPETARKDLAALNINYSPGAFAEAIRQGDEIAVKLFLQSGIDANAGNGAALRAAVAQGSEPLVRELLKRGAQPGRSNPSEFGPIDYAAKAGNLEFVRIFVKHGIKIDPMAFVNDRDGYETALDVAERSGRDEVVNYLLKQFPIPKEAANNALMLAVLANEPRLIKRYVELGADLHHIHENGDTAIGLAQKYKLQNSLRCLAELGVTVEAPSDQSTGPTVTHRLPHPQQRQAQE